MLLSIVIPFVNIRDSLFNLLCYFNKIKANFEIILVNQSNQRLNLNKYQIIIHEYMTKCVSAAKARNIGASIANGNYIFFLDDDAYVHDDFFNFHELLNTLITHENDIIILNRGEMQDNKYMSHWSKKVNMINARNFPNIAIEWNLIINKKIFFEINKFPLIGTGSDHAALSGEAYVLIAKAIARNKRIKLVRNIGVAHPNLVKSPKNLNVCLGYYYGDGYAIGYVINEFCNWMKFYWVMRLYFSVLLNFFRSVTIPKEKVHKLRYRYLLGKCKCVGFIDAISGKQPKPKDWLISLKKDIIQ